MGCLAAVRTAKQGPSPSINTASAIIFVVQEPNGRSRTLPLHFDSKTVRRDFGKDVGRCIDQLRKHGKPLSAP
jgi:hypothetical protein